MIRRNYRQSQRYLYKKLKATCFVSPTQDPSSGSQVQRKNYTNVSPNTNTCIIFSFDPTVGLCLFTGEPKHVYYTLTYYTRLVAIDDTILTFKYYKVHARFKVLTVALMKKSLGILRHVNFHIFTDVSMCRCFYIQVKYGCLILILNEKIFFEPLVIIHQSTSNIPEDWDLQEK
jgi:hypothetical protein